MKLSVVIAAYDEADNIEELFRRLEQTLSSMPEVTPEVVFVVEGSDGTHEALTAMSGDKPWVKILYGEQPSGLGAAFRRGFAAVSADADYVVTLDADLNHQPEEIPALLAAAQQRDCDVLVGSRFVAGSQVEGTPLWKRFLSGGVNRLMRFFFGLSVRDKTSGFRVYKADALRQLDFRNDAFAFLPELLVKASRAGLRLHEEPIHFVFRRQGRSKMAFLPTSWSYLKLLAQRFDRWTLAVAILFLVGVVFRVLLAFPAHKSPGDADCVLNGLCALKVLRGETPVFVSYVRHGSLASHLTAALMLVWGPTRAVLYTGPVILGSLAMVAWYLFVREILGRRKAAVALAFIAVPAPAFGLWTYMPNGYPQSLLLCPVILWTAALAMRRYRETWPAFAVGAATGVGFWCSLLTLACSAPAYLWMTLRRPGTVLRPKFVAWTALGFVLGSFPWLAYNILYGFPSLFANWAAKPSTGMESSFANAWYLLSYNLPEMLANVQARYWPRDVAELRWLRYPVLGIYLFASLLFVYLLARRAPWTRTSPAGRHCEAERSVTESWFSPWWIMALVPFAVAFMNVFSEAGSLRGQTVRYVLPVYLVMPALLAILAFWVARRSKWLAGFLVVLVFAFNILGASLPWTKERRMQIRAAQADDRLVEVLEKNNVDGLLGNFWLTYPINYYSLETITALPWRAKHDHHKLVRRLGESPQRWALLFSARHDKASRERVAELAGLRGKWKRAGRRYRVFIVRGRYPATDFLARTRAAHLQVLRERRAAEESELGSGESARLEPTLIETGVLAVTTARPFAAPADGFVAPK